MRDNTSSVRSKISTCWVGNSCHKLSIASIAGHEVPVAISRSTRSGTPDVVT